MESPRLWKYDPPGRSYVAWGVRMVGESSPELLPPALPTRWSVALAPRGRAQAGSRHRRVPAPPRAHAHPHRHMREHPPRAPASLGGRTAALNTMADGLGAARAVRRRCRACARRPAPGASDARPSRTTRSRIGSRRRHARRARRPRRLRVSRPPHIRAERRRPGEPLSQAVSRRRTATATNVRDLPAEYKTNGTSTPLDVVVYHRARTTTACTTSAAATACTSSFCRRRLARRPLARRCERVVSYMPQSLL
ncbi:hypothetical protein NUW54_g12457 [Trametes sanguinea]|uniref:Uncharacterized protein n=1 Tax=Trametes sanguinea TaxID=158606 RepID=A0ACC1MXC9_9APHY|nr:hypothetical protein NUW54_g12457 [Trametes sanguinea]